MIKLVLIKLARKLRELKDMAAFVVESRLMV